MKTKMSCHGLLLIFLCTCYNHIIFVKILINSFGFLCNLLLPFTRVNFLY